MLCSNRRGPPGSAPTGVPPGLGRAHLAPAKSSLCDITVQSMQASAAGRRRGGRYRARRRGVHVSQEAEGARLRVCDGDTDAEACSPA